MALTMGIRLIPTLALLAGGLAGGLAGLEPGWGMLGPGVLGPLQEAVSDPPGSTSSLMLTPSVSMGRGLPSTLRRCQAKEVQGWPGQGLVGGVIWGQVGLGVG